MPGRYHTGSIAHLITETTQPSWLGSGLALELELGSGLGPGQGLGQGLGLDDAALLEDLAVHLEPPRRHRLLDLDRLEVGARDCDGRLHVDTAPLRLARRPVGCRLRAEGRARVRARVRGSGLGLGFRVRVSACGVRWPHGSSATILSGSDHEGKGPILMAGSVDERSSACHDARAYIHNVRACVHAHALTRGAGSRAGSAARLRRGDLPARHAHRAVDGVGPVVRAWLGLG